jgi:putative Holliday junction resolvase
MRVMAFDIGDKRIGIALSDPVFNMALPLDTYYRKGLKEDAKNLAEFAKLKGADIIVCGLPFNSDGSESFQTAKTRRFVEELHNHTEIKIEFEDERYTTVQAEDILIEADMRREKRKKVIDKVAASYILENYLKKLKKGD